MRRVLILLLLCATRLEASPAFVQGDGNTASGSATVVATFGANLTSGNFVVCGHTSGSETVTWAVSNSGTALSWTTHASAPFDHSTDVKRVYVWYAQVNASDVGTVTATRSTGTATSQIFCAEFSGIATSSELDQTGTDEGTITTDLDASVTTTVADEALFLIVTSTTAASWTGDATSFTDIDAGLANGTGSTQGQYRIVASTGTYTSDGTVSSGNEVGLAVLVSFKGTGAAAGGCTGRLGLLGAGGCDDLEVR